MPLLSANEIALIQAGDLSSFNESHHHARDEQGNSILHYLVNSNNEAAIMQALNKQFSPYRFNAELKSPIGLALDNANYPIACRMLEQPQDLDETHFDLLLETVRRKSLTSKSLDDEIITLASRLCGTNIALIFSEHKNKQLGHLHWVEKPGKKGNSFDVFLPIRIYAICDALYKMGDIDSIELDYTKKHGLAGSNKEANEKKSLLIQELKLELKRGLQSYWVNILGERIALIDDKTTRGNLLQALTNGMAASIRNLQKEESYIICSGWRGHALYIQIKHITDGRYHIVLHNLGEGCELHSSSVDGKSVYPFPVGKIKPEAWNSGQNGMAYLYAVISNQYPWQAKKDLSPIIYNQINILTGENISKSDIQAYKALPLQTIGNCVIANYNAARYHSCQNDSIIAWMARKEGALIGQFVKEIELPHLGNPFAAATVSSIGVHPIEKAEIAIELGTAQLKKFYQESYSEIQGLSKTDKRLEMDLKAMQLMRLQPVNSADASNSLDTADEEDTFTQASTKSNQIDQSAQIDLKNLLKHEGTQVIFAKAGMGKSTLLTTIAYFWSINKLASKYEYVYLIRLQDLKNFNFRFDQAYHAAELVAKYCFNQELSEAEISLLASVMAENDVKTLWLLDSYEEAQDELDDDASSILEVLLTKSNVVVTSRPGFIPPVESESPYYEIPPYSDDQLKNTIRRYVIANDETYKATASMSEPAEKIYKELLAIEKGKPRIWELMHTPIYLEMVFLTYSHGNLSSIERITQLYEAFEKHIASVYAERDGMIIEGVEPELPFKGYFAKIALRAFKDADMKISYELIKEVLGEPIANDPYHNWPEMLLKVGVLQPINNGKFAAQVFAHPSLREYFAAVEVYNRLRDWPEEKFQAWFDPVKNELRYLNVWAFVTGLIRNQALTDRWFKLLINAQIDLKNLASLFKESPWLNSSEVRDKLADYIKRKWDNKFKEIPRQVEVLFKLFALHTHPYAYAWAESLESEVEAKKLEEIFSLKPPHSKAYSYSSHYTPPKVDPQKLYLYKRGGAYSLLNRLFPSGYSSAMASILPKAISEAGAVTKIEAPEAIAVLPQDPGSDIKTLLSHCTKKTRGYVQARIELLAAYKNNQKGFEAVLKELMASKQDQDIELALVAAYELSLDSADMIAYVSEKALLTDKTYSSHAIHYLCKLKEATPEITSLLQTIATKDIKVHAFVSIMKALAVWKIESPELNKLLIGKMLSLNPVVSSNAINAVVDLLPLDDEIKANLVQLIPVKASISYSRYPQWPAPIIHGKTQYGHWNYTVENIDCSRPAHKSHHLAIINAICTYKLNGHIFLKALEHYQSAEDFIIKQKAFFVKLLWDPNDSNIIAKLENSYDDTWMILAFFHEMNFTEERIKTIFIGLFAKLCTQTRYHKVLQIDLIKPIKAILEVDSTYLNIRKIVFEALKDSSGKVKDRVVETLFQAYLADGFIQEFLIDFINIATSGFIEDKLAKLRLSTKPEKVIAVFDLYEALAKSKPELASILEKNILANFKQIFKIFSINANRLEVLADGSIRIKLGSGIYSLHPSPEQLNDMIESIKKQDPLYTLREILNLNSLPSISKDKKSHNHATSMCFSTAGILPANDKQKPASLYLSKAKAFEDNPWYDDAKINTLLSHYCQKADIIFVKTLSFDNADEIEADFIRTRLLDKFSPAQTRSFLPLRINKNHWVGLYIDRQPGNPLIYWLDPYGNPPQYKAKLVEILNEASIFDLKITADHIQMQTEQLQDDGVNCGPWTVEILRFFLKEGRLPHTGEIDITAKQAEHELVLAVPAVASAQSNVTMELD
ncbi:MAG: hypothetical protein K0R66_152 [Gammaproteobacteria bacterium]|jgi:hypothetical protein|nr:hypothetical protein [Gammaproteobacteria bacterium]